MRVLHLIDAASDQATATTLALLGVSLGRLEGVDDHLLLLGGRSLAAEAALADLPPERVERLAVPFGHSFPHDVGAGGLNNRSVSCVAVSYHSIYAEICSNSIFVRGMSLI